MCVIGTIVSTYGGDGKFRVKITAAVRLSVGQKLYVQFKRYVYDRRKVREMVQDGLVGAPIPVSQVP